MRILGKSNSVQDILKSIVEEMENQNRLEAMLLIEQHNLLYPEDPWILHGTYTRQVYYFIEELDQMVELTVRITRIRSKKKNKTFSFQGGLFVQRSKFADLLRLIAKVIMRKKNQSIEMACTYLELPVSTLRMYLKRLRRFLAEQGCLDMLNNAKSPDAFVEEFISKLWFQANNPFCSEMECNR